jgi:hypothetical protein
MGGKHSMLPVECGTVLTAEVMLARCRWRQFWRDVTRLRAVGCQVEVEQSRGLLDRKFTVTADVAVLNWLFAPPGSH